MVVKKCCCGLSLKKGTLLIGTFSFVGGVINILHSALGLTVINTFDFEDDLKGEFAALRDIMEAVVIGIMIVASVLVIIDIILLLGAIYENPVLLVPWMAYAPVYMLGSTVLYVLCGYSYISIGSGFLGAVCLIVAIAYFVVQLYFMVVIGSYYSVLKGLV